MSRKEWSWTYRNRRWQDYEDKKVEELNQTEMSYLGCILCRGKSEGKLKLTTLSSMGAKRCMCLENGSDSHYG